MASVRFGTDELAVSGYIRRKNGLPWQPFITSKVAQIIVQKWSVDWLMPESGTSASVQARVSSLSRAIRLYSSRLLLISY
jgi:hypothetical protein